MSDRKATDSNQRETPSIGSDGFSLVEILVVVGVVGILALGIASMQVNQMKANNFLAFQLKRTQLQSAIVGQVLNDFSSCKCLFDGSTEFPAAGTAALTGMASPTAVGRYSFVTPGDCSTATIPDPLVDDQGIDGIKMTSIQMTDIVQGSGGYSGKLSITVQSLKDVTGPSTIPLSIPVNVVTVPGSPGNVSFNGCSIAGTVGNSCIHLESPGSDWTASISCPADHPYAIAGNCSTSCRPVMTNKLSGATQSCTLLSGGNLCVNPGQYTATASITCCR